jgi:D-alanine-D-alanine ligase
MADVGILTGGRSLERAVALRGAARVERALAELGHRPRMVDMDSALTAQLLGGGMDAAFVCAHGPGGEDGTLQELCELAGVPHTGSGVSASVRCFDKALLKHELVAAGIATPPWVALTQEALTELGAGEALPAVIDRLGLPLIVKPARMGSALGIGIARDQAGLRAAVGSAMAYDGKVVVERFREGARDLAVGLLGPKPAALPIVEAIPKGRELYDFEARYTPGLTEFAVPAVLNPAVGAEAAGIAARAVAALGLRAPARIDLVLSAEAGLEAIDLPTVPGLTETSLLPMAAEAAGIGFVALVESIIAPVIGAE